MHEIALAPGLDPVPSRDQIGCALRFGLSERVIGVAAIRNAAPAVRAQVPEIEVGEFVGDGDEPVAGE